MSYDESKLSTDPLFQPPHVHGERYHSAPVVHYDKLQRVHLPTSSKQKKGIFLLLVAVAVQLECARIESFTIPSPITVSKKIKIFNDKAFCHPVPPTNQNLKFGKLSSLKRRCDLKLKVSLKEEETFLGSQQQQQQLQPLAPLGVEPSDDEKDEVAFDKLLSRDAAEINLSKAVSFLQSHPNLPLTKSRWSKIFQAIEERTALADESEAGVNTRHNAAIEQQRDSWTQQPLSSQTRKEMTDMYQTLHQLQHLRLFGAVSTIPPPLNPDPDNAVALPAMGSDQVSPTLLETVTGVSMTSLTPKPTNSVLVAGVALAVVELATSLTTGISFNFLAFVTLIVAFLDRLLVNGAVLESFVKILSPQIQSKIVRHEAGHFLCAYLLGCPVEGCVLSAWAALQDARFGLRRNSVSAGTSFFDPILSEQIHNHISERATNGNTKNVLMTPAATGRVTKSSVNRYSIIVMAGIAAEAMQYGQADGGASDEMALIGFLSQLNRSGSPVWNDFSIRNQARWGALQAILMLREYKPCYDALVEALERGASLGECIYAIEQAGRDSKLTPLSRPLGYIVDRGGDRQEWNVFSKTDATSMDQLLGPTLTSTTKPPAPVTSNEATMAELVEYRKLVQQRLQDIESKLEDIN